MLTGASIVSVNAVLYVMVTSSGTDISSGSSVHEERATARSSCAQKKGPPAIIPAPTMVEEKATWNWTAKNAPEDRPDTETEDSSILYDSSRKTCKLLSSYSSTRLVI